ncbi:MAG: hypothetical protein OHK0046_01150 [Anaerolineae bacterium]
MNDKDAKFSMSEPSEDKDGQEMYAFWLTTSETRLFNYVKGLPCVQSLDLVDEKTAYVVIKHEYDADEVWHYICSELEEESQYVELDSIWEDAIWLL